MIKFNARNLVLGISTNLVNCKEVWNWILSVLWQYCDSYVDLCWCVLSVLLHKINCLYICQPLARSHAIGETAWQLPRVQTVASTARKLAIPINFRTTHDNSKTQLRDALNRHSHTHSIAIRCSIALVLVLCTMIFVGMTSTCTSQTVASMSWKIVSITCTNPVSTGWMRYWNYNDRIQFELAEVARPFLLQPGNKSSQPLEALKFSLHL